MSKQYTVNGVNYTTDNNGYITSGGAGSIGLNIQSIAGYNSSNTSNESNTSNRPTTIATPTVSVPKVTTPVSSNVDTNRITTPVTTPSASNTGTTTQVYMPGSTTPVQGQIINGLTYVNGQRVPVGAIVQTAGGYYQMTSSGGTKVSGPPTSINTQSGVVTPDANGNTSAGHPVGTVVQTANGNYTITGVGANNDPGDGSVYNPSSNYWSKKEGITTPGATTTSNTPTDINTIVQNVLDGLRGDSKVNGTQGSPGYTANTGSYISNTGSSDVPFEGIFNNFLNWVSPYIQKPVTTTAPSYDSVSSKVQSQLDPLLQVQLSEMKRNKAQSEKELAENLANRGVYNSSINDDELGRILNEYGDQETALRSGFMSNVANQAQSIYQNELSQYNSENNNYNQRMVSLGLALLNGTIDQAKFLVDDAYRNATLAQLMGNNVLSNFGTIQ